jgi:tripartite motif-containing protein 71
MLKVIIHFFTKLSFRTKILAILPFVLLVCITLGFSVAYSVDLGDGYSSGSGAPPECTVDTVSPPAYVQKIGRNAPIQSSPVAIAVSSDSYLYVLDETNHRVLKFDSSGGYVSQWGSYGTDDGQFAHPRGIAVDSANNVYVTENDNNRVQKFSSTGSFLAKWGSYGTGDGELHGPVGIAIDSNDNIYIVDSFNTRVQKFSSTGSFLAKWGSLGAGDGQFNGPRGIYIDATDQIYVTDSSNHRVQKFDSSGVYVMQWGSYGTGDGLFATPVGITSDSTGTIYVSDSNNNRIQRFSSSGEFMSKWGSLGSNVGQLYSPSGIAIDSANNFYVADTGNRRIQRTRPEGTGEFTKMANTGPVELFTNDNIDLAVNVSPGGNSYDLSNFGFVLPQDALISSVYATYENSSNSWGMGHYANGTLQLRTTSGLVGQAKSITILLYDRTTTSTSTDMWGTSISATDVNSIDFGIRLYLEGVYRWVYTDYISVIIRITTPADLIWSTDGYYGNGQWNGPSDVAVDASGNIYVVDMGNDRIQKFNAAGVFLDEWGSTGSGSGQFSSPVGIALDDEEHVYITDLGNRRIQKFDLSGNHIASISTGYPSSPSAIAIDGSGNVYMTDVDAYVNKVKKYSSSGSFLTEWGYPGSGDGAFNNPTGIAIGSNGHIFVVDRHNSRVQKFDSSGSFISKWGSGGSGDGQFSSPQGVTVDSIGNVYVSEAGNDRIQKFDSSGNFITKWGSQGTNNGLFDNPYGLYVDSLDNVYVADSSNNRIQKFTYDKVTVSTPDGVTEGGAMQDYTVVLNAAPSNDVTVTLSVSNPASGSSITVSPSALTFTASDWNIPQEVTITPDDDATYTGNRSASISYSMSSVDTSFNCMTLSDTTVSIIENDQLPQATPTSTPQPAPTLEPLIANRLSGGFDANGECIMQRPGGKPDIFRIDMTDTKATLYIAPPSKPYTQFYITYKEVGGVTQGNDDSLLGSTLYALGSLFEQPVYAESPEYAIDFAHENDGGVVVYTINELKPNTKYEFTIKCSNKCAFAETGNTLGASTLGTGSSAPKTYLAYNQSTNTHSQLIEYQLVNTGSPAYITIVVGFVLMILGIGVYSLKSIQVHDLSATYPQKFTLKNPRIIRYEW